MSGSRQPVGIRISAEGADKARRELEQLGTTGEAALRRIGTASAISEPQMQKLAQASDVANRAFTGMGGTLGRVGATFTGVTGVAGGMTAGFLALAAAAGVGAVQIAKAGDAATATLARLTSSTGGLQAAQTAYEGLYRLSQQTGVSVAESAGAFSRFAVAAKEIGGTNDQVLKLVGGIQKAGIVAGSSAQETASAVQQLGQSLAAGTLQGDELRSVLENMPQFAARLAKELGVGIGQLKQMGSEGKLTADVVFPAMLRSAEAMSAEFEKMPKTMSQAAGILGEASTNFLARLDQITGLSEKFRDAMLAGARAINGAAGFIAPNDRDRAASNVAAAQGRLSGVQAQIAAERAASAYGDVPAAFAEAERIAKTQLEEALAEQRSILRDARDLERADREDAATQRLATARARSAVETREIIEGNDERLKAARKFNEDLAKINRGEATGALSQFEADAARSANLDKYREALEKAAKANETVAAAVGKRTEAEREAETAAKKADKEREAGLERVRKATEKAADEQRRYQERSFDAVVNIAESAMERVGSAITDAFVSGNGAAVNFGNIAKGILGSVVADFAKLAIVNPILNSIFTSSQGARPTLGASGIGGLGDILSLGGGAGKLLGFDVSSVFGAGGLGGIGTSIFGSAGTAVGPLAEIVGASPGLLGLGGTSLLGGSSLSLGGAFGGVGLGLGAGTLVNGLLGGNQLGGTIGSGLGAAAGFLVGGPLGSLVGGAIGGGIGGLFGNSKQSSRGYSYALTGQGTTLGLTQEYYNEQGKAAFDEANQTNAAVNQYLAQRGLQVSGIRAVGGNRFGTGNLGLGEAGSYNEAFQSLRFTANDNRLNAALANREFAGANPLQQYVEGFYTLEQTLADLTDGPTEKLAKQIEAINAQFDALTNKAREYGLAEDGLSAARQRAIDAVSQQSNAAGVALLRDLTFGNRSALAPEQQYFAAISTLNQANAALSAGGSVQDYANVAAQVLPVARDFLGTSSRYGALTAEVGQVLARAGGDTAGLANLLSAQVDGSDALRNTFAAYGERQLEVASATLREMALLRGSIEALIARQRAA
jgi:tape measure domain-containing protein